MLRRVAAEHPLTSSLRARAQLVLAEIERGEHVFTAPHHDDLVPRIEKLIEPLEPVTHNHRAASRGLEQAPGRAVPEASHGCARQVERYARGTKEAIVSGWRQVRKVHHIRRPIDAWWVHGA